MASRLEKLGIIFSIGAVAACVPVPAPAPAPPPPPIVVAAPPPPPVRPLPPGGAAASFSVPPIGADGIRVTPNRSLSSNEAVWNFRSAMNVAALNCRGPVWDQIADNYNAFIKNNRLTLKKISRAIDREYRGRYRGQNSARVRDTKLTDLYNYYSLFAVKQEFCDITYAKSVEAATVSYKILPEFSAPALAEIDGVFIRFFNAFAQYQADLAEWNRLYASPAPAPTTSFAPASPGFEQPILDTPTGPLSPPPAAPTPAPGEVIFAPGIGGDTATEDTEEALPPNARD